MKGFMTAYKGKIFLLALLAGFLSCRDYSGGVGSRIFVIERSAGKIAVIDYRSEKLLKKISVKGDLHHASMVFDADLKYGYVAVRDGLLIRIDLNTLEEAGTLQTSESSIGLAISQDGKTIAVSEYKPGGITLVDVDKWEIIGRIPAKVNFGGSEIQSRVTGMVDGPDNSFLCALMDADEIWYLEPAREGAASIFGYVIKKIKTPVSQPFDALISPDSHYYITAHIGSKLASVVDLRQNKSAADSLNLMGKDKAWNPPPKMPHMESWGVAGDHVFVPIPGEKKLAMIDSRTMRTIRTIDVPGFPVYAVVRPDQREIWVTFSGEDHDGDIHVLDTENGRLLKEIRSGKRIYHIAITPRGDRVLVASNLTNELVIYETSTYRERSRIKLDSPSGIFGSWRAFQPGL